MHESAGPVTQFHRVRCADGRQFPLEDHSWSGRGTLVYRELWKQDRTHHNFGRYYGVSGTHGQPARWDSDRFRRRFVVYRRKERAFRRYGCRKDWPHHHIRGVSIRTGRRSGCNRSDAALWITEFDGNGAIVRITTAGAVTRYPLPGANSNPFFITAGPDGALWFTESGGSKIGRITTAGVLTEFPLKEASSYPEGITAGPDGALWFTENLTNKIGRITTSGVITEFPIPAGLAGDIITGPGGALWFTDFQTGRIGRITTAGDVTEYSVPTSQPYTITVGPDNNFGLRNPAGTTLGEPC